MNNHSILPSNHLIRPLNLQFRNWTNYLRILFSQAHFRNENYTNRVCLLIQIIANTHMCLPYGICIVLNSVPLSLDLTVNGPRP